MDRIRTKPVSPVCRDCFLAVFLGRNHVTTSTRPGVPHLGVSEGLHVKLSGGPGKVEDTKVTTNTYHQELFPGSRKIGDIYI